MSHLIVTTNTVASLHTVACYNADAVVESQLDPLSYHEWESYGGICSSDFCDFDAEYLPEELETLLNDHCFHVEQHPNAFFEHTGAAFIPPF